MRKAVHADMQGHCMQLKRVCSIPRSIRRAARVQGLEVGIERKQNGRLVHVRLTPRPLRASHVVRKGQRGVLCVAQTIGERHRVRVLVH